MCRKLLTITLAILSLIQCISATSVICYHGTWSTYRTGNGTYKISNAPANLCTHYIYTFVGLSSTTSELVLLDSWLDISLGGFSNAVALKKTNPNLIVLLAVGGWNEGSASYSTMAADSEKRATFVASALSWVQTYGFDGFDVDWEYPARRDSTCGTADKANFALLVQEMYAAFNPLGLLVTAAVSAAPCYIDNSYDVSVLSEYLDFINVMAYDFHGAWDTTASHNAPLYGAARFVGTEYQDYSINASIQGWLSRGASPSKLALGVPFYGRTVILSAASANTPGSATTSTGGDAGPYTASPGFLGYNEIVEKFNAGGWTTAWDDEQQVPYAYCGTTWLSYDNEKSIALKVEYAKSLGLGAIMIWSIETDDFLGNSGTTNPLLTTINNALDSSSDSSSSSSATTLASSSSKAATATTASSSTTSTKTSAATTTTSTTTTTTTTKASSVSSSSSSIADANSCTATGYFVCSSDCGVYYYCQLVNGVYVGIAMRCSSGLYYDSSIGVCNYASLVTC